MIIIVDLGYVAQTQELILSNFTQAKWLYKGYVPSVDEYKSVALRTIGLLPIAVASFVDLGDFIDNLNAFLKTLRVLKRQKSLSGYKVNNILHSTL